VKRRVVVTGVGLVTPLGTGVAKSWKNICAGKSGIGLITRFDTSDFQVKIAAEVRDFNVEDFLDRKTVKHFDLFVQYGLAAAMMAVEDSGVEINEANCGRVGVITGCGIGGLPAIEKYHQVCLEKGHKKLTPFFIPMVIPNMPSGHISIQIGYKRTQPGLDDRLCRRHPSPVGEAYRHIQYGLCDVVVTGGAGGGHLSVGGGRLQCDEGTFEPE